MSYTKNMHDRKQDWKTFTRLKEVAVERYFEQAIEKYSDILQDASLSSRERYHHISQAVRREDKELAAIFDSLRHSRSQADLQLQLIVNAKLLTQEELSEFSEATLEQLNIFSE